ncbi:MAG: biotin synthase BioB [Desulfobulbus propionicus]|nr:MAG: biotin synthase BioB [Desulfobulbus propionicus]
MTSKTLSTLSEQVIHGTPIDLDDARALAALPDKAPLFQAADKVRRHCMGNHFHLCSIINARSGNCSENCRFCAQSARHHAGVETYTMIEQGVSMAMAMDNDQHGVHRLSLVTAGRSLNAKTLSQLTSLYHEIAATTSMALCASTGMLSPAIADSLVTAGVSRYHCNLEANQEYFPKICTTHTWAEKVETLKIASKAGMSLCSGGIIGMGESMDDRIVLAMELREMEIFSIPINILTPIQGTPLEQVQPLDIEEILTVVALFRLINPRAVIRMAGGRQQMGLAQYRCFTVGANGAIVGNYLTTAGSGMTEDLLQLSHLGYTFDHNASHLELKTAVVEG